jgi:hypothetical protein
MSNIHPIFAILLDPFRPRDTKPPIVTHYWAKPMPDRTHDWVAFRDGEEERMQYGYGATKEAAIAELLMLEEDGYYT